MRVTVFLHTFWLFVLMFWLKSSNASQSASFSGKCESVTDKFRSLGSSVLNGHKLSNDNICQTNAGQTCCTSEMEVAFRRQTVDDLHSLLKSSGAHSKAALLSHLKYYNEHYLRLLQVTMNKTESELESVLLIPKHEWRSALSQMFKDLANSLENEINVASSVDAFFANIFPSVFQLSFDVEHKTELTAEYRNCLNREFGTILPNPFGDTPQKWSKVLNLSLGSVRSFLRALRLVVDVIDSVEKFTLNERCANALTRLTYCSECAGHETSYKPCAGFCYNVLRGCLVEVHGLDHFYKEFINSVHRTALRVLGNMKVENELNSFPSRVEDAIVIALTTASDYSAQVTKICGDPNPKSDHHRRVHKRSINVVHRQRRSAMVQEDEGKQQSPPSGGLGEFNKRLEGFLHIIVNTKGFVADLGDSVCKSHIAAGLHDTCWNGSAIAPYVRHVAANTFSDQETQNPELTGESMRASEEIVSLKQKIAHMIRELNRLSEITNHKRHMQMQADAPSDDEDAGSASGYEGEESGSAEQPETPATVEAVRSTTQEMDYFDSSTTTKKPHHPVGDAHRSSTKPPWQQEPAGGSSRSSVSWWPFTIALAVACAASVVL